LLVLVDSACLVEFFNAAAVGSLGRRWVRTGVLNLWDSHRISLVVVGPLLEFEPVVRVRDVLDRFLSFHDGLL